MGTRRYGRILFRLALVVVLACFAFWWVFYANKPAQQAAQLTVIRPDGTPVTLTLWSAEPRVDLPFTTDTAWVRVGQAQGIIHGRAFGGATGEVLVSPDCTQALV